MRFFSSNTPDNFIQELIQQAVRNLLGGAYKYKELNTNTDTISDMLAVMSEDNMAKKLYDKDAKVRYEILTEALGFANKARLTYGIIDPVESMFVWFSIMEELSLDYILSNPIEINFIADSDKRYRENKESRFFDFPDENTQRIMGGLPLVNCALALTNASLDKKLINKVNKILSKRIKKTPANRECKHFVLISNSTTIRYNVNFSTIKKIAYAVSIILKIMEINIDRELFIYFHDTKSIVDKISIKTNTDRRKFWLNFGVDRFSSYNTFGGFFNHIYEILESTEYHQCRNENIQVHLDIITDKQYEVDNEWEIVNLSKALNRLGIRVNFFLLDSLTEVKEYLNPSLIEMARMLKDRSLFIPDKFELVDCTDMLDEQTL